MIFQPGPQNCIIRAEERVPVAWEGSAFLEVSIHMANGNAVEPEDKQQTQKKPSKRPYTKPAFRFERVFETQALSCGKINSTIGQCHSNRKTS